MSGDNVNLNFGCNAKSASLKVEVFAAQIEGFRNTQPAEPCAVCGSPDATGRLLVTFS